MANLNKVMLIGNLTRDPEVKYTPKGSAVAEIGLAINRFYTLESGEKREETTFVDVTFFGRQAETIKQYCSKGKPLYVEGRLQLDTWDDKQTGQKRSKLRVQGENFQFLGSRQGGGGEGGGGGEEYSDGPRNSPPRGGGGSSRPPAPPPSRPRPSDPDLDPADDDIPF